MEVPHIRVAQFAYSLQSQFILKCFTTQDCSDPRLINIVSVDINEEDSLYPWKASLVCQGLSVPVCEPLL